MSLHVSFSPEAQADLDEIEAFIAKASHSTIIAEGYIRRLVADCRAIGRAPYKGTRRDDIRPGIRTTGFERRATILFEVLESEVLILAILYGGRELR